MRIYNERPARNIIQSEAAGYYQQPALLRRDLCKPDFKHCRLWMKNFGNSGCLQEKKNSCWRWVDAHINNCAAHKLFYSQQDLDTLTELRTTDAWLSAGLRFIVYKVWNPVLRMEKISLNNLEELAGRVQILFVSEEKVYHRCMSTSSTGVVRNSVSPSRAKAEVNGYNLMNELFIMV